MHGAEQIPTGVIVIYLIIIIASLAGMWKIYEKAGHPGWKALIPIYNLVVLMRIIGKPAWWVLLMLIPYIGIIWSVWSTNLLSKSFGRGIGFTLGLFFLPFIFYPVLGFSKATYTPLDGGESITDALHDGIDEVQEAVEEVKESASTFADKTENFVTGVKEDAEDFVASTKERFTESFSDEDKK